MRQRNAFIRCAWLLALACLLPGAAAAQAVTSTDAAHWREDLATLRTRMEERHRNLFHSVSREDFDRDVASLHARIPSLSRDEIIVAMMRLVARVGDGHTAISPTRDKAIGFHRLPIALYDFEDGLFVRAATTAHADLVGARVLRIGKASTEEAMRAASGIIAQDNAMDLRFFAPVLLAMPEVLHGLGLEPGNGQATLQVEQAGRVRTVTLDALDLAPILPADTDTSWMPQPGWVDLRDAPGAVAPAWLRDARSRFRLEHWPERHAIYAQLNQVTDSEDESFAAFSARLLAMVAANPRDKLVLDLRLNRGGNGTLLKPLEVGLLKSAADRPCGLLVLQGRSTWSAAQFLLNFLDNYTQAIFVGEPSGSRGNIYGDSRKTTLPHSGITVRTSVYYWQDWLPWDTRQWTAPSRSVPLTSTAYRENRDPALEAALACVPEARLRDVLAKAIEHGGPDAAVAAYRHWSEDPLHRYADAEEDLLLAGMPMLEAHPADALRIFELDAERNPHSWRAWYAKGAAQLAAGDAKAALGSLERAEGMNPRDYDLAMLLEQARAAAASAH